MQIETQRLVGIPRYTVTADGHSVGWVVYRKRRTRVGYVNSAFGPGEIRCVGSHARLADVAFEVALEARRNRPGVL